MTADFRARLREEWIKDHGEPTWVEELLIEGYAEHLEAALGRIIGDNEDWQPLGFLGAADPVVETEEQRVARGLVPLVRTAAAEVPVGDVSNLRLDPELARLHCFVQAERKHTAELPCWCGGFLLGGLTVHQDDRIPWWSAGYAFSNDLLKGWPA